MVKSYPSRLSGVVDSYSIYPTHFILLLNTYYYLTGHIFYLLSLCVACIPQPRMEIQWWRKLSLTTTP
jgi:hypothetical protein